MKTKIGIIVIFMLVSVGLLSGCFEEKKTASDKTFFSVSGKLWKVECIGYYISGGYPILIAIGNQTIRCSIDDFNILCQYEGLDCVIYFHNGRVTQIIRNH